MPIPLLLFLFGAIIGSFANVCIQRMPKGASVISPGSHCPRCQTKIKFYDNIPLISFFVLKGKCRVCGTKLSPLYPIVEFLIPILYLVCWARFGITLPLLRGIILCPLLVIITCIDYRHQIIPDVLTLPFIIVGILISFFPGKPSPASSLLGLLSGGSFFYLLALLSRGGMGGGDIKFIAMLGAFTGVKGVILIIILASLIGSSVGITLILLRKKQMRDTLPFGPYLSLGALIVILFQKEIINWYEGNFFFPF